MAIDLLVLPLCRYWSGDYVLPAMETAWSLGSAYTVLGPSGARTLREGEPFGGSGAPAEHAALARSLPAELARVGIGVTWNEADAGAIGAWRVDPRAFGAAIDDARRNVDSDPGFFGRLRGERPARSHLGHASVLVPSVLDAPITFRGVAIGSAVAAVRELEEIVFSPAADPVLADLREALGEARRRRLPLVIDG